ncbi:MAG: copper chaperone PCu(A)C [Sulfitobacter sp.]
MKRIALLVMLVVIAMAAFLLSANRNADVILLNAQAIPLDDQNNRFVVTFEIQNYGPAKTLIGVESASARMVHIMNPGYNDAVLVVPANSSGFFAMDGAHVMVMGTDPDFVQGASLPLTLRFANAGDVTTRVLNLGSEPDMGVMDHNMSTGIRSSPSPSITLDAKNGFSAAGADISVQVENFSFVRAQDDAHHVALEGHAHIYLNGLKLGRLYETEFSLGALPSGNYDLSVSLNSNNHQPYVKDDEAVRDTLSFVVQ